MRARVRGGHRTCARMCVSTQVLLRTATIDCLYLGHAAAAGCSSSSGSSSSSSSSCGAAAAWKVYLGGASIRLFEGGLESDSRGVGLCRDAL